MRLEWTGDRAGQPGLPVLQPVLAKWRVAMPLLLTAEASVALPLQDAPLGPPAANLQITLTISLEDRPFHLRSNQHFLALVQPEKGPAPLGGKHALAKSCKRG